MSDDGLKKWFGYGIALVFVLIGSYLVQSFTSDVVSWSGYLTTTSIFLGVIIFLSGLYWFFVLRVRVGEELDVKKPVSIRRVKQILFEEVPVDMGIPFWVHSGKIVTYPYDAVVINTHYEHVDESMQTSDKFFRYELSLNTPTKQGLYVGKLQTDLGEEHIRENWDMQFHENVSFDYLKPNKDFPPTSAKSENTRIELLKHEAQDDGFSKDEIMRLEALKQEAPKEVVVERVVEKSKSDKSVRHDDVDDVDVDFDDKEEWRRNN